MNVQELCRRYPNVGQIISLGNENREHSPEIARICDYVAGLTADLIGFLPVAPAPEPAPVARFDPYTGQPVAPAPAPTQVAPVARFDPYTGQPVAPAPAPTQVAPVARFDPYTGQPIAPAPAPTQVAPSFGTPGLSQGWPAPAQPVPVA